MLDGNLSRIGKDEWLFLTEELRFYPDAAANQAARIAQDVGSVVTHR